MKADFRKAYERELTLLRERAGVFAAENPGIAERLGGLLEENLDPSIAGLLEGSAFLAARVQLNIDQQFRTFSTELLEQLFPESTAPLPSAMLVQSAPPENPPDVIDGQVFEAGSYLDSHFRQGDRRIVCRYRLAEPVTLWPVALKDAAYHSSATPLNALGCDTLSAADSTGTRTEAGLVFTVRHTMGTPLHTLRAPSLPIHFTGPQTSAIKLYEQVFSQLKRITLRWELPNGEPVLRHIPLDSLQQVGFDPAYPLFGRDERVFPGYSTLLEYFAFPRKFLGMALHNLTTHLRGIDANEAQIILEFTKSSRDIATRFDLSDLGLFCAPAVNLFEDDAQPVSLDNRHHHYPIIPNKTPSTNYEVHRVLAVRANYEGVREKVAVLPLYALPTGQNDPRQTLYYTLERKRRRLSREEVRSGGVRYRYEGTESWITLYQPPRDKEANLLFLSTLCSNRHLPEILAIAGATFHYLADRTARFTCIGSPSMPREAMSELEQNGPHRAIAGDNNWRLISFLSLSQRGFSGPDGRGNIDALKEMLRLFSDISDQVSQAQINAILDLRTRQITRTLRRSDGYHSARGIEITLTCDETILDTGGLMVLGAVIDRFLADYATLNSFTQLTLATRNGTAFKTFAPRSGSGPLL